MVKRTGLSVRDAARPHGDIEVSIAKLRPDGELREELLIDDNPKATEHPRILHAQKEHLDWVLLRGQRQTPTDPARHGGHVRMLGLLGLLRELGQGFRPEGQALQ